MERISINDVFIQLNRLLKNPDSIDTRDVIRVVERSLNEVKLEGQMRNFDQDFGTSDYSSSAKTFISCFCAFLQESYSDDGWKYLNKVIDYVGLIARQENSFLPIAIYFIQKLKYLALKFKEKLNQGNEKLQESVTLLTSLLSQFQRIKTEMQIKNHMIAAISIQLFWLYFRLAQYKSADRLKTNIQKNMTESLYSKSLYSKSIMVSYDYYEGRMMLFESNLKTAYTKLEKVLHSFPRSSSYSSTKNLRQVLKYMIPLWLYNGVQPDRSYLVRFRREEYIDLIYAVKIGSLRLFRHEMQKFKRVWIKRGLYLMMEKFQLILYRNLFKKVYRLNGSKHIIETKLLQKAVAFSMNWKKGKDINPLLEEQTEKSFDINELECIVATLIHRFYIKGYISHEHSKIVLSKDNPFPDFEEVNIKQHSKQMI
jgi:hypothetical protein